ncbi:beta strand repeat-containing protein [Sporosarcina ureae]|uniref:beta strand repeat-containing protein n=1 Tax=Sporosarcina ureae TaxID=1571 RepID=UPI000A17E831|nr:hypothetical protein [Sporosarcina ureae]ARK22266.1 hypothetical protein SporoP32a_12455 [Sporosarcina ureae]
MKDKVDAENLNSLHFTIDGLTVSNAAVKQTDDKTVVLTTAVQKGGEKYTVTLNDKAIGSFTGVSAVVPEKIKMTQSFNQSKVGKQVILTADIGVKEAGVPVTFNIDAPSGSLNKDIIVEVPTNAEGLATYSYTQYAAGTDVVSVYPTGAPTTRDVSKVYWGVEDILAVTESATGEAINGTTRTYEVVLRDPVNGQPLANQTVNVAFKENIDSANGTNAVLADPRTGTAAVTPFQSATNERAFSIVTDANGKAVFTLTGANTKVTPIVYLDNASIGHGIAGNGNGRWEAGELQAVLPTVEFKGAQSGYTFDFGTMTSAEYATGLTNNREYKVTVKKADGTPYANGQVQLGFEEILDNNLSTNTSAVYTNKAGTANNGQRMTATADDKGVVTFYVAEPTVASQNVKATPAIWIDLDAAGNTNGVRESGEPQALAPSTTFQQTLAASSALAVTSQATEGPHVTGDTVNARFQLLNQSNQLSTTAGFNRVTYTITNTSGAAVTFRPSLTDQTSGASFTNMTTSFANATPTAFTNNSAVTINAGSSITISGTAPGFTAAAGTTPDVSTTNRALLSFAAPDQANSFDISATGTAVRATATSDARNVTNVSQAAKSLSVVRATVAQNATTYAGKIIGFTTDDDTAAATFGRVVVQLDNGSNIVVPYKAADTVRIGTDGNFAGTFTAATFDQFENKLAIDNRLKVAYVAAGASTLDLANVKNIGSTGNAKGNTGGPISNGFAGTTAVPYQAEVVAAPGVYFSNTISGSVGTGSITVTDGTDALAINITATTPATIATEITDALAVYNTNPGNAATTVDITAVAEGGKVKLSGVANTNSAGVTASSMPEFNVATVANKVAAPAVAAQYDFDLSGLTSITAGDKFTVNGTTYTAVTSGGSSALKTFTVAGGAGNLNADIAALATVVNNVDTTFSASSTTTVLELTQRVAGTGNIPANITKQ